MSTSELLQQLETCAQMIMASPDQVSASDRNSAQEVFLNFQKTKNPFDLCRDILENSSNQFVLFQAGCCLKNGVIRDWGQLSEVQARSLFSYLFEFVNRRPVEQFVIEELMLVGAIILKRILINDTTKEQDKVLIVQLCDIVKNQNSPLQMRLNACTAISLILAEFCTINQNSDYGISWYTHLIAKRHFEKLRLKDIFQTVMAVLFDHLKIPAENHRSPDWIKLSTKLIRICDTVLSWNFNFMLETFTIISAQYARNRDRLESLVFQPPSDWIEFIIDGNLISFFFEVYIAFRKIEDANLVHQVLQCLNQLSTMTGPLLYLQRDVRKKFTEMFMVNTITLTNAIFDVVSIHEVVFLANFINSICNHLRSNSSLQYVDFNLARQFFGVMAKLSCKVIMDNVGARTSGDEESYEKSNQSVDYLVTSWMVVINVVQFILHLHEEMPIEHCNMSEFLKMEEIVTWTRPIFETYLRSHLCQPEGLLPPSLYLDDDDTIQEFEEDDSAQFREQLGAIGCMAQIDAAHSINTLVQLLLMKLGQFEATITSSSLSQEEKQKRWTCLCEDIHWVLLISMNIFTVASENEVPSNIMKLSIASSADVAATQLALQNADITATNIDPVVRFFIVMIKLVNMEKCLLEQKMSQWVSPQVSITLTMFIARFMQNYLVPPEFDTEEMSLSLNTCFGADSPPAKHLINFFLDHLVVKFASMTSEVKLLELSAESFLSFCKYKDRIQVLQQSSSLALLLEKFSRNELPNLNSVVRRNMYNVFVVVFNSSLDPVIDPLIAAYQKFYVDLNAGNKELVREQFLQIVECTQGISFGMNNKTFPVVWTRYLQHIYNDLPRVMNLMHNYSTVVQAILELLFTFSVSFCCFLKEEETITFYDTAVNILNEYATHNKAKVTMDGARIEELQAEFTWILKFLNDLSTQDIFYFFSNPSASSSLSATISKVVLTSLNIIMPLMNDELLEDEKLCSLYYKLLEFIAQDSDRFRGFPFKLFESFLKCVDYAFKAPNISNEIKTVGFKIIIELGFQAAIEPAKNEEVIKAFQPFFRTIFEFIFLELVKNNDYYLRDIVALALYSLLCCYQNTYKEQVLEVLHLMGNYEAEQAIAREFFEIVEAVGFQCSVNQNRLAFKKRFSDFIHKLHTLLSLR